MPAEVETMCYHGEIPWHRSGNRLATPATAAEAIVEGGLDWEVEKRELYFKIAEGYKKVRNRYAVVRRDTNAILGDVSSQYIPIQNRDCFSFFDQIVGEGRAIYHTAGVLRGGQYIWLLAKLPESVDIVSQDAVDQYLVLSNCHSGKRAIRIQFTPIRVVCMNTLNAALMGDGIQAKVWHMGNIQWQFKNAAEFLGITSQVFHRSVEIFRELAKVQFTKEKAVGYFQELVPDNPDIESNSRRLRRERLLWLFEYGKGADLPGSRGTAWQAYNAVTEYVDHVRLERSTPERRLWSNWFTTGAAFRQKAYDEAVKVIA